MKAAESALAILLIGTWLFRPSQGQDGNCTIALLELSSPKGALIDCDAKARYGSKRDGRRERSYSLLVIRDIHSCLKVQAAHHQRRPLCWRSSQHCRIAQIWTLLCSILGCKTRSGEHLHTSTVRD